MNTSPRRLRRGSYTGGLLLLAALGLVSMGIALMLGHDGSLERAPAAAE